MAHSRHAETHEHEAPRAGCAESCVLTRLLCRLSRSLARRMHADRSPSPPSFSIRMDDLEAGGGGGGSSSHSGLLRLPLSLLTSTSLAEIGRSRILVLGDSGVGKSMLVQRITGRSVEEIRSNAYNVASTTGCATECKLFQFRGGAAVAAAAAAGAGMTHHSSSTMHSAYAGHSLNNSSLQHRISSAAVSPSSAAASSASSAASSAGAGATASASSLLFLEFWDVSGHRKYLSSRPLFYRDINAILLVFDLMNRKSYENIRKWIREIVKVDATRGIEEERSGEAHNSGGGGGGGINSSPHQSPALRPSASPPSPALLGSGSSPSPLVSALGSLPVLLIGTKADLYRPRAAEQGSYESVKDFGLDCVHLSAFDEGAESHSSLAQLDKFFERVCARKMARATDSAAASAAAVAAAGGASRRYSSTSLAAPFHPGSAAASHGGGAVQPVDPASAHSMSNRRLAGFGSAQGSSGGQGRASFSVGGSGVPANAPSSFAGFSIAESNISGGGSSYGASNSPFQHPRGSGGVGVNSGSSAYSRSSDSSFVPPPIRTLADFTADDSGGSPGSASSPTVLSPSSSSPPPRSLQGYGQTGAAAYPSYALNAANGSRSMRDARAPPSSLPANTALAALSQQRRGSGW